MSKEDRWQKIDDLIKQIEPLEKAHSQHPSVLLEPIIKATKVLVHVAKIQEESTQEIVALTRRLQGLTWALVILSVALLFFAFVQTKVMVKQDASTHAQQVQRSQSHATTARNQ